MQFYIKFLFTLNTQELPLEVMNWGQIFQWDHKMKGNLLTRKGQIINWNTINANDFVYISV